jgi:hypothetical protein|tara:strand:- start:195 stop:401 length:207 start_codon:yes stop_codon:yes gene_type:complete
MAICRAHQPKLDLRTHEGVTTGWLGLHMFDSGEQAQNFATRGFGFITTKRRTQPLAGTRPKYLTQAVY